MMKAMLTLTVLLLSAGCSTIRTQSSSDPATDLTQYQTYQIESKSQLPAHLERRIEQALQQNLAAAGLSPSTTPDLLVRFHTVVKDEVQLTETPATTLVTFRRGYTVWNTYETDLQQVTQGTLLVDIIDTRSDQLVWEGTAQGLVPRGQLERNTKKIEKAVARMFARFPDAASSTEG